MGTDDDLANIYTVSIIAVVRLYSQSSRHGGGNGPEFFAAHPGDLKGKVVYLDFWASWCPPCRKSFPWMNEMERRYSRQGLAVVAVNLDKDHELADKFLNEVPARFTVAFDPQGTVAESYRVPGMPSSFIIDRNGKIQAIHIGFREEDSADLETSLRSALSH